MSLGAKPVDWILPTGVHAMLTDRGGGVSRTPYDGLNLGDHVGDRSEDVVRNREILQRQLGFDRQPIWLSQVHGNRVLRLGAESAVEMHPQPVEADASYTRDTNTCLAIMVADCLPILICSQDGQEIAGIHAGWRGLAAGIIQRAVAEFEQTHLHVWLGPCIGPCHYEVDEGLKREFVSDVGFTPASRPGHWMFDLRTEARRQLETLGVSSIRESEVCTHCNSNYYSYRRDGTTGRFAALLWRG